MTTTQLYVVVEIIGLIVILVGGYASIRALAKAKGVEASIALLTTANEGLRQANRDQELARLGDRQELTAQLHQQELDCAKQISELRGQVSVLTGSLAQDIVTAVMAALPKGSS